MSPFQGGKTEYLSQFSRLLIYSNFLFLHSSLVGAWLLCILEVVLVQFWSSPSAILKFSLHWFWWTGIIISCQSAQSYRAFIIILLPSYIALFSSFPTYCWLLKLSLVCVVLILYWIYRVQFEDVHRLSDGQVKHSPEVFYAGSLWKVF